MSSERFISDTRYAAELLGRAPPSGAAAAEAGLSSGAWQADPNPNPDPSSNPNPNPNPDPNANPDPNPNEVSPPKAQRVGAEKLQEDLIERLLELSRAQRLLLAPGVAEV